jgi:hypothetical protein
MSNTNLKTCSLETTQANLRNMVSKTLAEHACLLGLLSEHPSIEENQTLMGAVSAIQSGFVRIWDEAEAVADQLDSAIEAM